MRSLGARCAFLAALGLNLVWLLLGDRLSLYAQMAVPVATVALGGLGVLLWRRRAPVQQRAVGYRRALWALLLYYLAILSVLLFFGGLFCMDRGWGGSVNLEPLHTIRSYLIFYRRTGSLVSVWNLLGNIVIFVPLGVLLPLMFPFWRHLWRFLPLALLVPCGVEWLQWRTATGIADVDDALLNTAGALAGYLLIRFVQGAAEFWKRRNGKGA